MLAKGTHHSKITGNFGEMLLAYLLSRIGWEVVVVDHTGIDLMAARDGRRIGISVKSRSRDEKRNEASINLPRKNIDRTRAACETFGLEPYYAFVCDRETKGVIVYLAPEAVALEVCGANNPTRVTPSWPMKAVDETVYRTRREVDWFDMATQESSAAFKAAVPRATQLTDAIGLLEHQTDRV
jgi:hypothetical protein